MQFRNRKQLQLETLMAVILAAQNEVCDPRAYTPARGKDQGLIPVTGLPDPPAGGKLPPL